MTDTTVKIWNLNDPFVQDAIRKSYLEPVRPGNKTFKTYTEQSPLYSTSLIHTRYVDSVRWVGDCVLSKSINGRIVLWCPDSARYKVHYLFL